MSVLVAESISVQAGETTIVEPLDLRVDAGECVAIIGESGSGKTMTARAIVGLLPRGVTATGTVRMADEVVTLPAAERVWSSLRGDRVALLVQDPFTSLSPVHRCGAQLAASLRAEDRRRGRARRGRAAMREEVIRRLAEVRLDARVARQYPHELSGGMRQRLAIAAALAADPQVLVADEPTTALDATVQGEVLDLLAALSAERGMGLLLISHDLGIVAGRAARVMVMSAGQVVESGPTESVLTRPEHPYTRRLLEASPSLHEVPERRMPDQGAPVAEMIDVVKSFGDRQVLHGVSIELYAGQTLALVGESGSGKSTLARVLAGLETAESGSLRLRGEPLPMGRAGRHAEQIQVVFQDPNSTLNPSFTVRRTLAEALGTARGHADGHRGAGRQDVDALLRSVDLDPALASRHPASLSGGQRQRVAIARAIAVSPEVLICDEMVSALDVSVQEQILTLLDRLRADLDLAVLFISHDLAVVSQVADRVAVMSEGRIVETGTTEQVIDYPRHEYTARLVESARSQSLIKE
ncbi:ABC transporter ATP-binding protein [Gordonia jinhuaensis]|uniref:ABC transporter ATP-binding protein n=1 Tax=Gordonia jinhuaensis TaxID=1517702 RepID=A0A916X055_9ACTN|nr:ABC transporter ATP-binding protein [Gordonia jinhuaensis]GGB43029.1 ABC transporter ATP-binding protein [Gordonia jinhuaensis]